jgi:hypothetical protein
MISRRRHALWIVGLGVALGIVLYVGYIALGIWP